MSTPIQHPQTDVVVLGLGHMGGPIAAELTKGRIQRGRNRERSFLGLQY